MVVNTSSIFTQKRYPAEANPIGQYPRSRKKFALKFHQENSIFYGNGSSSCGPTVLAVADNGLVNRSGLLCVVPKKLIYCFAILIKWTKAILLALYQHDKQIPFPRKNKPLFEWSILCQHCGSILQYWYEGVVAFMLVNWIVIDLNWNPSPIDPVKLTCVMTITLATH